MSIASRNSLLASLGRRLLWSLVPASVVIVAVWGTVFGEEGLLQRHTLKQRLFQAEDRLGVVQEENARLREQIGLMQREPMAVRRAAAEQLLAAEAGSTIYRFEPEPPPTR